VPVQTTLELVFRALTTHRTRPKGAGGGTIDLGRRYGSFSTTAVEKSE